MSERTPIPVLAIVGPTASGKTAFSIELAKRLHGEIISADSMQIYASMGIASAAPTKAEQDGIVHHMLGFLDPEKPYSVAEYVKDAKECILKVHAKGKLPMVVGGTGLYVDHLLSGTQFIETETDEALRENLQKEFDEIGGEAMLQKLAEFDPETAKRLHPNNQKRIIRAFEIYALTGETMTEALLKSQQQPSPFAPIFIGLNYENRDILYDRIHRRVDIMLQNGLLEEAKAFYQHHSKTAAQAIGYKELKPYLDGEMPLEEAVENLKKATRHYAKRQMTWFKRNENMHWLSMDVLSKEEAIEKALEIVKAEL